MTSDEQEYMFLLPSMIGGQAELVGYSGGAELPWETYERIWRGEIAVPPDLAFRNAKKAKRLYDVMYSCLPLMLVSHKLADSLRSSGCTGWTSSPAPVWVDSANMVLLEILIVSGRFSIEDSRIDDTARTTIGEDVSTDIAASHCGSNLLAVSRRARAVMQAVNMRSAYFASHVDLPYLASPLSRTGDSARTGP